VLFHLSGATFSLDDGLTHLTWDDLRPRHVVLSMDLEGEFLAGLAAYPGSGVDGGSGRDKAVVKRRIVIDVPPVSWYVPDTGFMLSFAL
jgi:phytoene dehydrogenase-like protein